MMNKIKLLALLGFISSLDFVFAGGESTVVSADCKLITASVARASASDSFPLGPQIPIKNMQVVRNGHAALTLIVGSETHAQQIVKWVGKGARISPFNEARRHKGHRVEIVMPNEGLQTRVRILESLMHSPELGNVGSADNRLPQLTHKALETVGLIEPK